MRNAREIDSFDRKILSELLKDGRLTNVDLAKKVGLSASPCWARVKDLEARGIIERYTAILDRAALGLPETMLLGVTLDRHDQESMGKFEEAIAQMPEVVDAYIVAGDWDFHLEVAIADTKAFEKFLRQKIHSIKGVLKVRSTLALRRVATRGIL